ncbi:MAG: hypothetical protein ACTSSI_18145 [Candidatus Helarchaeota archaeon]
MSLKSLNLKGMIFLVNRRPVFIKHFENVKLNTNIGFQLEGFLTVLNGIQTVLASQQLMANDERLIELIFSETHIRISQNHNVEVMAVLNAPPDTNDLNLIQELKTKFSEFFAKTIQDWDKNLAKFDAFQEVCEEITKKYK